jgi:hypothetical protein
MTRAVAPQTAPRGVRPDGARHQCIGVPGLVAHLLRPVHGRRPSGLSVIRTLLPAACVLLAQGCAPAVSMARPAPLVPVYTDTAAFRADARELVARLATVAAGNHPDPTRPGEDAVGRRATRHGKVMP